MAEIYFYASGLPDIKHYFKQPSEETLQEIEALYPLAPSANGSLGQYANWNEAEYAQSIKYNGEINTWFRPGTGCQNWGTFRGLVDQNAYDYIHSATRPMDDVHYLVINDGSTTISQGCYIYSIQTVTGFSGVLYLLTLVDRRFFDKSSLCNAGNWADGYTWDDYLYDTTFNTGLLYSFETPVESVYGYPDPDSLLCNLRSSASILEAVAWNTGRVVTLKYDGELYLRHPSELPQTPFDSDRGKIKLSVPGTFQHSFPVWSSSIGWDWELGVGDQSMRDGRDCVNYNIVTYIDFPDFADTVGSQPCVFSYTTKNTGGSVTAANQALADALTEQACYWLSSAFFARQSGIYDPTAEAGFDCLWTVRPDRVDTILARNPYTSFRQNFQVRTTSAIEVYPSLYQDKIQFQDEGVDLGTDGTVTVVDFTGAGVTATRAGDTVTVDIPGGSGQAAIQFKDEGSDLGTPGTVDTIDFTGSGVTATRVGDTLTVNIPTPSPGAPTNATYVTLSTSGTLTDERVLTAGSGISITDGGAGGSVTIAATGTGAPTNAQYVTLALDGTLTNERVLTAGTNITIVDGGANNPVTLSSPTGGTGTNVVGDTITAGHTAAIGTGLSNQSVNVAAVYNVTPAWANVPGGAITIATTGKYALVGKAHVYTLSGMAGITYIQLRFTQNGVPLPLSDSGDGTAAATAASNTTIPLFNVPTTFSAGDVIALQAYWFGAPPVVCQVQNLFTTNYSVIRIES